MFGFGKKPIHVGVKLGKKAAKFDTRTLRFAAYKEALPPAPESYDFSNRINNIQILLNDVLGDCTAAGAGHLTQAWTAYNGIEYSPSDQATLDFYEKTCGYNTADPSTDCGGVLLDVLKQWKSNGFDGHEIDAFVSVDPKNVEEIKQALFYFGGLYVGVQLPKLAMTQDIWDVPWYGTRGDATVGSEGGHCIANILDYDDKGLTCITWGAFKLMTWKWLQTYADEMYCILSPDWYGHGNVAPTGFDSVALAKDITLLEAS